MYVSFQVTPELINGDLINPIPPQYVGPAVSSQGSPFFAAVRIMFSAEPPTLMTSIPSGQYRTGRIRFDVPLVLANECLRLVQDPERAFAMLSDQPMNARGLAYIESESGIRSVRGSYSLMLSARSPAHDTVTAPRLADLREGRVSYFCLG